jgi:hypothetical protein
MLHAVVEAVKRAIERGWMGVTNDKKKIIEAMELI